MIKVQTLKTQFSMSDGKTAVIGVLTETVENNVDSELVAAQNPAPTKRPSAGNRAKSEQHEINVFVTVGLADSATIGRDIEVDKGAADIGMPMNAVLGRGLLDGTLKELGDRTEEEMFNLKNKPAKGFRVK